MAKKIKKHYISNFDFNLSNFKIIYIGEDSSVIYRCKFCRYARIKKEGLIFIRIKGHVKNCKIFKFKQPQNALINNIYSENEIKDLKLNYNSIWKRKKNFQINENKIIKNMDNIIYKSNYSLFGKENTDKIICGNYAFFPKRLIGKGSFSNTYFGYKLIDLQEVSIKLNRNDEKISTTSIEVEVLKKIKEFRGFSKNKGIWKYGNHDAIIQDWLGPSSKKIIEYFMVRHFHIKQFARLELKF